MNLNNDDKIEEEMTSFRKASAEDKLRNGHESDSDTRSSTKAMVDETQATLKLKDGPSIKVCTTSPYRPVEEDLNMLTCSTSKKYALSTENDVFNGEIVTEIRSGISLGLSEDAEHVIRDIPVDEGVLSEDKLPVNAGCPDVMEELSEFKTVMADKSHCDNNDLEMVTDHLKLLIGSGKECNPEGHKPSIVDAKGLTEGGLQQLKENDKGMLKEAFILHSSIIEEKHVCIAHEWEKNALAECIHESAILSPDITENISEVRAEDAEKDRKSAIFSSDQEENILGAAVVNGERESGLNSNTCCSINCLDVRLESSNGRTHLSVDSSGEAVTTELSSTVAFSRDKSSGGGSLGCGAGADSNDITSHDNHLGESCEVVSHNNYAVEIFEVKEDGAEFPNCGLLDRDMNGKALLGSRNNSLLQMSSSSTVAMDQSQVGVVSSFESTGSTDASIIGPVEANASLARDHFITKGCLESEDADEKMQEHFLSNSELGQQVPTGQRVVAVEHKLTFDGQNSLEVSYLRKNCDGTCDLNKKHVTDSVVMNCPTSEKSAGSNIPVTAPVDCNATRNAESEGQQSVATSGFADRTVLQRDTGESINAELKSTLSGQNSPALSHSRKGSNGTGELPENLLTDSLEFNCATTQKTAGINVSAPAMAESNVTKNVQSQSQGSVVASGFAGHSVSQMGSNVSSFYSGQSLHESSSDVSGEINGNNDAAELSNYTCSGLIPLSGPLSYSEPISYSGPIPFSGSISLRSDSSTTSTRSFAFPILASEWNSSPVKMAQPDSRYLRNKRRWRFFSCCRK